MEKNCPCCSGKTYQNCCAPFLTGKAIPQTAEQLMRSRYSAFAENKIDYIHDTMREKALNDADISATKTWAASCKWLKLDVKKTNPHEDKQDMAEVSFVATYEQNGKIHELHENSLFKNENNKWYYIGSVEEYASPIQTTKIGRNEPCPCGSGKKYKKCCYQVTS